MRKTSVYLPDLLKEELADLARRSDRSEADLIRAAIERLVHEADAAPLPAPPPTIRSGPRLVGVGVGPSAPDLVTERALAVLRAADRVVAPSTGADAIGRAEAVVRAVAPEVGVDRLVVAIGADDGARRSSLEQAADALVGHLDRGEVVAVAVLGDPSVYSVFPTLARLVRGRRSGVPVDVVPGVMAFQELAAQTSTVVADGDEELVVLPAGDDTSALEDALEGGRRRSVVVYRGGRRLPEMAGVLDRRGRLDQAVVGEMLGLPGGRGVPVSSVADRPASYLATVIVPPARGDGP